MGDISTSSVPRVLPVVVAVGPIDRFGLGAVGGDIGKERVSGLAGSRGTDQVVDGGDGFAAPSMDQWPDLLDAEAAIKWAVAQLPVLENRITQWRNDKPHVIRPDTQTDPGKKLYRLYDIKAFDPIINAEAGAIIHSIRSSLDLMASALAVRNNRSPGSTYFPIWKSEAEFLAPPGKDADGKLFNPTLEKIDRLSQFDKDAIRALKPYPGANGFPLLCALHDLDLTRKHRRLLNTFVFPRGIGFNGFPGGAIQLTEPANWHGYNEESILAWTDAAVPDGEITIGVHVAFDEAGAVHGKNFTKHPETISLNTPLLSPMLPYTRQYLGTLLCLVCLQRILNRRRSGGTNLTARTKLNSGLRHSQNRRSHLS